jgi:hypothetical protein
MINKTGSIFEYFTSCTYPIGDFTYVYQASRVHLLKQYEGNVTP